MDKNLNTFSMRIKEWFGWHVIFLISSLSLQNCALIMKLTVELSMLSKTENI